MKKMLEGWTLEKQINLGEILTMLGMVFTLMTVCFSLDKRVTVAEVRVEELATTHAKERDEMNRRFDRLEDLIAKVGDEVAQKADRPHVR